MRQDMAVDQIYSGNSFRVMVNRMKIYQVLIDINEQEALKDSDYNCFFLYHTFILKAILMKVVATKETFISTILLTLKSLS